MKRGVQEMLGKTLAGVVLAENALKTRDQLLLVFADDTFFEFRGTSLTGAASLDPGTVRTAASYAKVSGFTHVKVHQTNQPASPEAPRTSQYPVEAGFLHLAGVWQGAAVAAGDDRALSFLGDQAAMACLLIAKERSACLGPAAARAIQDNIDQRRNTSFKVCDSLAWELCQACCEAGLTESVPMSSLLLLMGHPNSNLRWWGMKLGWLVRERLPRARAVQVLLRNAANTLGSVALAIGLAASCFESEESFFEAAAAFKPPEGFESQFEARIAKTRELGPASFQVDFLIDENRIRKLIEDHCMAS